MYWQLGGDKVGPQSLVGTAASQFGTLDQTPNHISYVSMFTFFCQAGAELECPGSRTSSGVVNTARTEGGESKDKTLEYIDTGWLSVTNYY